MGKANPLKVGSKAPDFKLLNQDGKTVMLANFRGRHVLLYFYPKAMTPGCTVQACSLRDSKSDYLAEEIVVLGISTDSVPSLKKFAVRDNLNFDLLSDPAHLIASQYGVWGEKMFMGRIFDGLHRVSFIIDPQGKIVHVMPKVDTKTHHQDVLEIVKKLLGNIEPPKKVAKAAVVKKPVVTKKAAVQKKKVVKKKAATKKKAKKK